MKRVVALGLLGLLGLLGAAQAAYRQPSAAVQAALDAPMPARSLASPDGRWLVHLEPRRFVPLNELARPTLRGAGMRFDPRSLGPLPGLGYQGLRVQALGAGPERRLSLPGVAQSTWHGFAWSPDSRRFLLHRRTAQGNELWVGTPQGGLERIEGLHLNLVLADPDVAWWSPSEVVVLAAPLARGTAPKAGLPEPQSQEHAARASPEPTHADLLRSAHEEDLLAHHARAQLARVNLASGEVQRLGAPDLFFAVSVLPGQRLLMTERTARPFVRQLTWEDFPQRVELRDAQGRVLRELAQLPARQGIAVDGVLPGPRVFYVGPDAAVYWVEALDGGNPQTRVAYRDRLMRLDPPYQGAGREVQRIPHRFTRLRFLDDARHALLTETDRSRAVTRTYLLPLDGTQSRLLFEHALRERFRHPGSPLMHLNAQGLRTVQSAPDGSFWFVGQGAGAKGERPFLDRYNVRDYAVQRVFQADQQVELPLQWLDGQRLLTSVERSFERRQLGIRSLPAAASVPAGAAGVTGQWQPLNLPPDLPPALKTLRREVVHFRREDGVDMAFTVVYPPDHQPGQKRPALVWAYPLEFTDAALASQSAAASERSAWPLPGSPVWLALEGFIVVTDATMPVVGDTKTVNDNFLEQLQLNARAIVEQLDELGGVDLKRIAIGGQSYGAFMAVNLLAHTNLFKAGIARSGAYNRTLTPFGFQSERRSLWEAREVYLRLSPLLFAHQIKEPLLLLHGELDPTPGTPLLQSERLYHALAGLGQTVRLTVLPLEGHSLASREAAGHVQWEMSQWLRRHLGDPRR